MVKCFGFRVLCVEWFGFLFFSMFVHAHFDVDSAHGWIRARVILSFRFEHLLHHSSSLHIKTKLRSKVLHKLAACHLMQIVISLCCHLSNWIFQFANERTISSTHSIHSTHNSINTISDDVNIISHSKYACSGKIYTLYTIININYYNEIENRKSATWRVNCLCDGKTSRRYGKIYGRIPSSCPKIRIDHKHTHTQIYTIRMRFYGFQKKLLFSIWNVELRVEASGIHEKKKNTARWEQFGSKSST